jgi:hypothetical protein
MEVPIRVKELGDIVLEMPGAHTNPKSDRLSSEAVLGILSSFPRKAMSSKVEDNFVAQNLDTEFALFGFRTSEIWWRKGRATNQENLDGADFMETKFASLPRRISCKARWCWPQGSPRAQIQALGRPRRGLGNRSMYHNSSKPRSKHQREMTAAASLRNCLGDGLEIP